MFLVLDDAPAGFAGSAGSAGSAGFAPAGFAKTGGGSAGKIARASEPMVGPRVQQMRISEEMQGKEKEKKRS